MTKLDSAILKTLNYFDLYNHPLTLLEVYKFLIKEPGLDQVKFEDVRQALIGLEKRALLQQEQGFYFLPHRQVIVWQRLRRYRDFLHKAFKAVRVVRILKYVPYVRGVALSGSLAGMYPSPKSDIDFLIIVKPGRMWLGRIMVTTVTQFLGVRRYGDKVAGRICLNHYVVSGYKLENDRTLYAAMEYASLLVLLGEEAFGAFYKDQAWLADYLVNPPDGPAVSSFSVKDSPGAQKILEGLLEVLGANFWEKVARKWQQARIKPGPTVLVGDNELSFHPDSKGVAQMERFEGRMGK